MMLKLFDLNRLCMLAGRLCLHLNSVLLLCHRLLLTQEMLLLLLLLQNLPPRRCDKGLAIGACRMLDDVLLRSSTAHLLPLRALRLLPWTSLRQGG